MFFFVFVFETPLKDFLFFSPILVTLWFGCLQTHIKESCMYLYTQIFSQTPHETLKFQEKPRKKSISQQSFPFAVYHGPHPRSCWTKQTVKKLNIWVKTDVDKSLDKSLKHCIYWLNDATRYNKIENELEKFVDQVSMYDIALCGRMKISYTSVILRSHVDDFLCCGTSKFLAEITHIC